MTCPNLSGVGKLSQGSQQNSTACTNNISHGFAQDRSKTKAAFVCLKVKEETEKAGLKLNIQKAKIMASGPITS